MALRRSDLLPEGLPEHKNMRLQNGPGVARPGAISRPLAALPCPILADAYLRQLERTPLIIVDEVGYRPCEAEAASLPALGRTRSRPSTPWHRPPHRPDVLREGRCALWAGVSSPHLRCGAGVREAHVFFQLISSRYERASVIVTSNKPFTAWPKVRHLRGRDPR